MIYLSAKAIACARGEHQLFSNVSMMICSAQVMHIQGANGSGKTSLLRILAGLNDPTEGCVDWHGHRVAYLGHQLGVKLQLTVVENLRIAQVLFNSSQDLQAILDRVNLAKMKYKLVAHLSAGQQRRVALAHLLLQPASIWVLDEPLTALDTRNTELVKQLIHTHVTRGGSVVLSSHQDLILADTIDCQELHLHGN